MAKKKEVIIETPETPIVEEVVVTPAPSNEGDESVQPTDTVNLKPETPIVDIPDDTTPTPDDENGETIEEEKPYTGELPEMAKKILQQFSNEEELYIDKQGGVFGKGTQPNLVKNAILYKNPYYNK